MRRSVRHHFFHIPDISKQFIRLGLRWWEHSRFVGNLQVSPAAHHFQLLHRVPRDGGFRRRLGNQPDLGDQECAEHLGEPSFHHPGSGVFIYSHHSCDNFQPVRRFNRQVLSCGLGVSLQLSPHRPTLPSRNFHDMAVRHSYASSSAVLKRSLRLTQVMDRRFCANFYNTAQHHRILLLPHLQGGAITGAKDSRDKPRKRNGAQGSSEPTKGKESCANYRHYHRSFHTLLVPWHDFINGAAVNRGRLFENRADSLVVLERVSCFFQLSGQPLGLRHQSYGVSKCFLETIPRKSLGLKH